jgi:hypothetical protein
MCTVSILIGCASVQPPQAAAGKNDNYAAKPASDTSVHNRVHQIQMAKSAIAADAAVAFADEKIQYLWTMLPQQTSGTCNDTPALAQCQIDALSISSELDQQLARADATYDEAEALSLYEASRAKATECKTQEFDCLVAKFDGFGGNADTRRYMVDALKSLEQRQQLVADTGIEASLPCLDAGVQQYQSRIAQDYQEFSREPVLASQEQLHRDFRGLYDAQVACLQTTSGPRPTAQND